MNKLIIILGLVLLSAASAVAANLQTMDGAKPNSTQTFNGPNETSTGVSSIETNRGNNTLTHESNRNFEKGKRNHQVIIAGYGDPDGRGTPGEGRGSDKN